jgi:hypothetical protein
LTADLQEDRIFDVPYEKDVVAFAVTTNPSPSETPGGVKKAG